MTPDDLNRALADAQLLFPELEPLAACCARIVQLEDSASYATNEEQAAGLARETQARKRAEAERDLLRHRVWGRTVEGEGEGSIGVAGE